MQQSRGAPSNALTGVEISLLAVLLLVDSLHFVFARLLLPYISPNVSAMYVLIIATVMVGVYGLVRRELHVGILKTHIWFFVAIGALIAGSTAINYAAVAFIDAGTAAMLGKMTVLFSMAYGIFWLHERLTRGQIVGALIAVAGVFVITFQPADYLRVGSLMVVGSTFLYSTHAALVKRHGGVMNFLDFFFYRLFFTALFLFLLAAGRNALELPSRQAWLLLLLVATVDVVLSRSLYYLALRRLKMSVHAVVLTLTPVAAILWSFLLFDTFPTPQQLLGGAAVLAGVMILSWRRPR